MLLLNLFRPPPGDQSKFARYSIAYFCRPGNDVQLRALAPESNTIAKTILGAPPSQFNPGSTAGEWTARRIRNLRLKSRAVSANCYAVLHATIADIA